MFKRFIYLLFVWLPLCSLAEPKAMATLESIHNFHQVTEQLLTAGQVKPEHIDALASTGTEMVINLAPASIDRNKDEGFLLTQAGISYVQIPVAWDNPTDQDLQLFFAMMDARQGRKTMVHCFANYRASAFTYLYRVLREGVPESEARDDLYAVWSDEAFAENKPWRVFIDKHLSNTEYQP